MRKSPSFGTIQVRTEVHELVKQAAEALADEMGTRISMAAAVEIMARRVLTEKGISAKPAPRARVVAKR
jgi:antitoxin component of RelBE/YafQ-DinJ toxin-antitoxin module